MMVSTTTMIRRLSGLLDTHDRSMRDGAPVEDCDDAAMAKDQK